MQHTGPSGFDGRPLRQRFPAVPGYPGAGIWHTFTDVDVDGFQDLVVENEYYQVLLLGSYPGISAYKSKLNPSCPYFETLEPESGSVGKLRPAVIGEEMYYSQEAEDGQWDGTMDYSGRIDRDPWWDGIFKLYTPMRAIEDTRKVSFRVDRLRDLLHVVQTATFSPLYEPIVKIEYHYVFAAADKAFYWYNLRQFGKVDAPIGSTTRIGRMHLAGKVPVGWALPCNKVDCYDSYYWSKEFHEPCQGDPWKQWIEHSEKELPWLEDNAAPHDSLMLYYDSRGTYGGSGAIVFPGWLSIVPHVRCSMSRQYRGWWRVDDLTREDTVHPGEETHGGLCACIVTGPDRPLEEARQIVTSLVDTSALSASREVKSAAVIRRSSQGLSLYVLNPRSSRLRETVKLADLAACGIASGSRYAVESLDQKTGLWQPVREASGTELQGDGIGLSIDSGALACMRISPRK